MLLEGACMEGSPPCPLGVSSVSSDFDFGFQSLAPPVDELTRSPHLQPMEKLWSNKWLCESCFAVVDARDSNTHGYQLPAHTMLEVSTRKEVQVAVGRL